MQMNQNNDDNDDGDNDNELRNILHCALIKQASYSP